MDTAMGNTAGQHPDILVNRTTKKQRRKPQQKLWVTLIVPNVIDSVKLTEILSEVIN